MKTTSLGKYILLPVCRQNGETEKRVLLIMIKSKKPHTVDMEKVIFGLKKFTGKD